METVASQVISLLRGWLQQTFPGSIFSWEFIETLDGFDGFGISLGSSLSLVFIDSTDEAPWQWAVNIYSGLALDCPDSIDALIWANGKNRGTLVGKYHIAVHQQNN